MKKRLKYLLANGLAALVAGTAGCVHGPAPTPGDHDPTEQQVQITISVPGAVVPTTRSIAVGGEATVNEIDILVFKPNPGGSGPDVLDYRIEASQIGSITAMAPSDGTKYQSRITFTAPLALTAEPRTLAIIANASEEVEAAMTTVDDAAEKQDVLEALAFVDYQRLFFEDEDHLIPMYGETRVTRIEKGMKIGSIELTRMFARVDVINRVPEDFTISEIEFTYREEGYIAPAWDPADGTLLGSLPDEPKPYPANNWTNDSFYPTVNEVTGFQELVEKAYFPEMENHSGGDLSTEQGKIEHGNSPHLLIRGTWTGTGGDGGEYWYRVDFTEPFEDGDRPEEVEYVHVFRNHLYTFNITAVEGRGYGSKHEAQMSLGVLSNLKTHLLTVDQSGIKNINFNGQYWIGIDSDEVALPLAGNEGTPQRVRVSTNHHAGWKVERIEGGNDWLTVVTEYATPEPASHAAHSTRAAGDPLATALLLTATANNGATQRTATIHLSAGRVTHCITVTQEAEQEPPVDTSDWVFEVNTENLINYSYNGGEQDVTVISHDDTGNYVRWEVVAYSEDGGTNWNNGTPSYLFAEAGPEEVEQKLTLTMDLNALTVMEDGVDNPDDLFIGREQKGTDGSRWNLASPTGGETVETANCYIVDAPGYYQLPLVYGNGIKGGTPNTGALVGGTFVNYADQPILEPYITNGGGYGNWTAAVIWQDKPDLITDLTCNANGHGGILTFNVGVGGQAMTQGNAVVAVRNVSGVVLWSWHIWITPFDMTVTDVIRTRGLNPEVDNRFMQYNLGWIQGQTITFEARSAHDLKIRIRQDGSNEIREITLVQNGTGSLSGSNIDTDGDGLFEISVPSQGYNVFYQWGRKDPMPNKYYINGAGYTWDFENSTAVTMGTSIQNPNKFYRGSNDWCSTGGLERWDVGNTESGSATFDNTTISKSIYDPCPPGFSMPPSNAFRRITKNGGSANVASDINVASFDTGDDDLGWWIYSEDDGKGPTVFFPHSGYYQGNNSGTLRDIGIRGLYYTALPQGANTAYYLRISSEAGHMGYEANPVRYSDSKRYGYSVRPMVNP